MNLLLHHLRKDLRFARWMILFTLVLASGALWFSSVPLEERAEQIKWLYLSRYGSWLLALLTAGNLIQLDAPFREGGYLKTRPAPRSTVFLSKMIAVLILIVPLAMIECLLLILLDLKPGATNLLLVFAENLLTLAMVCSVSMAMSIGKKSAAKFNASVIAWIGIWVIGSIAFIWCKDTYFRTEIPEWSDTLGYLLASRSLMAQIVALTSAVIGIVLFVRSGRRETISKSLAITAVCAIATLLFWPHNFVKTFVPPAREAPKNEWPDPAKLKFTFEEKWVGGDKRSVLICVDGGYNGVLYRSIDAYGSVTGLTGGWKAAYDNSYQSLLTLSNGKTFSRNRKARAGLNWQAILPQLGIPNRYANDGKQIRQFPLTEFKLEDAADALTGAKLSGTMQIHLKRPLILARIPLQKGASSVIDGSHFAITDVVNSGDEIHVNFVTQTHMVHLHGGRQMTRANRFNYAVIHAERREFLDHAGAGGSNLRSGHYSVLNERISGKLLDGHKEKSFPPDWIDGAEFLIIGEENGGSFSQSFDFPNINLSNER